MCRRPPAPPTFSAALVGGIRLELHMRIHLPKTLGTILIVYLLAQAVLLLGIAFAQDTPITLPAEFDPRVWFGSAAALGAFVFAAVGFAKEHVFKTMQGRATIGLSFALGVVIAVVGSFTPYFEASLVEAVLFGASAALIASGGWDGLKTAIGKGVTEAPVTVTTDLPPVRRG